PSYIFEKRAEISTSVRQVAAPGGSAREEKPALVVQENQVAGENWPAIEREMILQALKNTKGNRSKAAELLGWGRTTLWRKIVQHGLA
ncbi:MAG: sigma-54-dependent Fis family transcriptional regulator, partial [Desulfobulbaceae bacterium]